MTGSIITNYLHLSSGVRLRYRVYDPEIPSAADPVILLHGRGDSLEKYEPTLTRLMERDITVFSFDWRGQGRSSRLLPDQGKGHVDGFESYLEDLDHFLHGVVRTKFPPFVIAQSMGAHVALRYAAERDYNWSGAILCAPMMDIKTRRWPRPLATTVVESMLELGLGDSVIPGGRAYLPTERQFEGNPLTGDRENFERFVERMRRTPEIEIGGPTFGWIGAAFRSIEAMNEPGFIEKITTPTRILVGDGDIVVDLDAIRRIVARLPNAKLELVENARHEIMLESEPAQTKFWKAVDQMLLAPASLFDKRP